jgi:AraC-like DNA-binding protein
LRAIDPRFDDRHATHALVRAQHVTHDGRCASRGAVTHSYAALALYTDGSAEIEQRGRWRVEPGDCVVVPAGAAHRGTSAAGASYWGAALSSASAVACEAEGALSVIERVRDGACPVLRVSGARRPFVETLFRELAQRPDASEPVQKSLLTLLVHELDQAEPREAASGAGPDAVQRALRFIERNCLRTLSLDEVADAVSKSPAHLTTLVRRATGQSVGAWIIAGRMAEARRRLARSAESVQLVAERVGYADTTHFIRLFKRAHGASPAQWRAALSDRPT